MRSAIFLIFCASFPGFLMAQDYEPIFQSGAKYEIVLYNGTVLIGTVTDFSDGKVTINTTAGDFTVLLKDIRKIKGGPEKKSETNLDWYQSPKRGSYILAPSAIEMEPNEFNYQNSMVFINSLNYGVTHSLVIGGGFELISTLLGEPMYYLLPRFTFPVSKNWRAGAGFLLLSVKPLDINLAQFYGMVTYGNSDRNFTLGVGYGFSDKTFSYVPTVNFSAIYRFSKKIAFITENWYAQKDNYIISYGIRLILRRISFDFTFVNNYEIAITDGGNLGIPFATFMIRFGKLN